jgi:hypothetical protein
MKINLSDRNIVPDVRNTHPNVMNIVSNPGNAHLYVRNITPNLRNAYPYPRNVRSNVMNIVSNPGNAHLSDRNIVPDVRNTHPNVMNIVSNPGNAHLYVRNIAPNLRMLIRTLGMSVRIITKHHLFLSSPGIYPDYFGRGRRGCHRDIRLVAFSYPCFQSPVGTTGYLSPLRGLSKGILLCYQSFALTGHLNSIFDFFYAYLEEYNLITVNI